MGKVPTIPFTLFSLYDAEKREKRPLEQSVTPSPKKPAQEIDICGGNTSFPVDKVKKGFKIKCCNTSCLVKFSMLIRF